jgi:branched-chain amino acid transport system substrate-binding protein
MGRMTRFLATLALAACAFAPGARADSTGVTDTTIKIGIPGPLTGSMASSGAAAYGVAAIYRAANEQGGINGRKFDIVMADDACNEAKSVAVTKRLIFDDKVFLINGNVCSGPALAAKPVIEDAGVPWVISTAVNQALSNPAAPTTFQASQTSRDIGEAMAKFALSKPGVKKIAIIEHTNEWSKGYRDPAVDYLKSHGVTAISDYYLERGQTDATSQVLRIRAEQPDFILVILYEPEQVVFLRDAHKFGMTIPMMGSLGGDFSDTEARLGSKEPMLPFTMAMQYAGLPNGPKMQPMRDTIAKNSAAGRPCQ